MMIDLDTHGKARGITNENNRWRFCVEEAGHLALCDSLAHPIDHTW
jgi:hypothetical protein